MHTSLLFLLALTTPVASAQQFKSIDLQLKHEAGTITVQPSTKASPTLGITSPTVKNGVAYLSQSSVSSDWVVSLSPKLPIALHLTSATSDVKVNLLGLNISSLDLNHVSGDYQLKLPARSLKGKLNITSADMQITVPKNTGLKLNLQKFVSGSVILEGKTVAQGVEVTGTYQTGNFDSASNKIELDVIWHAGDLKVVR